jgi:hypothetical protein
MVWLLGSKGKLKSIANTLLDKYLRKAATA